MCPARVQRDWPASGDRFPAQYDSGGECGKAYYRHTLMPTPAEDKPWYSFDFGPIHFIQYSTGKPRFGSLPPARAPSPAAASPFGGQAL